MESEQGAFVDNYVNAHNKLVTALKKQVKYQGSKYSRPVIQDKWLQSFPENLQQQIEEFLGLVRRRRLNDEINETNTKKLEDRKRELEQEIVQLAEGGEDPLDSYIEWTRIFQQVNRLQDKLAAKRKEIAQPFLNPSVKELIDVFQDSAVAHYMHPCKGLRLATVSSSWSHPLDSPLVNLISALSSQGTIISHYKGFLHLSDKPFTAFEKGLFGRLRSIERNVIPKSVYQEFAAEIMDDKNPTIEDLSASFPDYYDAFKIPQSSPNQSMEAPDRTFLSQIYTAVVMSLAHVFVDSGLRNQMGLPEGNPVACLIVSEKGEILSWAINTQGKTTQDIIRHAEVNALNIYFKVNPTKKNLPTGTYLFTSHRSCEMCAGAIYDSVDPNEAIEVIYGQKDPGQTNTIIAKKCDHIAESQAQYQLKDKDLLQTIDAKYTEIKNDNKTLNAAESFTSQPLFELSGYFLHELRKKLNALAGTPAEKACLQHIVDFVKINGLDTIMLDGND